MNNKEDFIIVIGNIKYFLNGTNSQREMISQSLQCHEDQFETLLTANDHNCLMRAEAVIDDAVAMDTVKRLNLLYMSEGRYLMP